MTNHIDSDLLNTVLQLLTSEGSSGFAEGLRLLVDEAMVQQERCAVLQARPYERCDSRLGRANGCPATIKNGFRRQLEMTPDDN
jgi:hypothetical protein